MKIAGVVQIRDDSDIAESVLKYYSATGVNKFFIFLHKPVPEILLIIDKLKKTIDIETFSNPVYDQTLSPLAHNALTEAALRQGYKWIVGFDVDDIFILRKHNSFQDFLKDYDNHNIVSLLFPWANYYPPFVPGEFYKTMQNRGDWTQWTKCIAKFDESMTYVRGLHFAISGSYGQRHKSNLPQIGIDPNIAFCGHFPFRSEEHLISKFKMRAELDQIISKTIDNKDYTNRYKIIWKMKLEGVKIYDPIPENILHRF